MAWVVSKCALAFVVLLLATAIAFAPVRKLRVVCEGELTGGRDVGPITGEPRYRENQRKKLYFWANGTDRAREPVTIRYCPLHVPLQGIQAVLAGKG